jgi:hypothetical protein
MPRLRDAALISCGAIICTIVPNARALAQLRPVEPLEWDAFSPGTVMLARAGVGVHRDMRAALAGTEGRLLELGNFTAVWTTGRVVLEASGTLQRRFTDQKVFAAPYEYTRAPNGQTRVDAGAYSIATTVRLTPAARPFIGVLRFGTRLPTTDNRIGLDRDATDFFATAGGRYARGGLLAGGELGLGIFGTRVPTFEQSDVLLIMLTARYTRGLFQPVVTYTMHADGLKHRTIRGNEALREFRFGLRAGNAHFLESSYVYGRGRYSPHPGFLISAGFILRNSSR